MKSSQRRVHEYFDRVEAGARPRARARSPCSQARVHVRECLFDKGLEGFERTVVSSGVKDGERRSSLGCDPRPYFCRRAHACTHVRTEPRERSDTHR